MLNSTVKIQQQQIVGINIIKENTDPTENVIC